MVKHEMQAREKRASKRWAAAVQGSADCNALGEESSFKTNYAPPGVGAVLGCCE